MTDPRGYSAGTRAALAQLSRGSCYNPECSRSIISFIGGEPYVDYQIAHIRDAKAGNRYVPDMTDDERRAFENLVLLCKPCHTLVDKTHPRDYNIERLDGWKRQREGASGSELAALGSLDEAALALLVSAAVRSAVGNPAVVVSDTGGVVRITSVGLPRLVPLEPATVPPGQMSSPSRLVGARSGVVPFTVHRNVLDSLSEWCHDGAAFSARIVAGKGGAGKTRLAVQLCEDLASFGWVRGLLTSIVESSELEALVAALTARLVVIDYAEARAGQVASVVPQLAAWATKEHPVRVLLLVRTSRGDDWAGALRHHGPVLDALVDEMGIDVLEDLPLGAGGRRELFLAAAEAFADRGGLTAREVPRLPPSLSSPSFATPLLVVIKAYLEVHGSHGVPQTQSDLLEELIAHEDRYWRTTGCDAPTDAVLRRRVVALATLAGARSEVEAAHRLLLVPDLADASQERRMALARWANALYQGRLDWWNPLEPDLVAEHLVATTYHDHPEVLAGVVAGSADLVTRPIALYARAALEHPLLAEALKPIFSGQLTRLYQMAIEQAATVIDMDLIVGDATLAAALARWAQVTEVDTGLLLDAMNLMPLRPDLVLNPLSLVLHSQVTERFRVLASTDPTAFDAGLAMSLNNLAGDLCGAGRDDEGLAASVEAVEIYRRLVAGDSGAHEADFAMSLVTLSMCLGRVGREDEGLAASVEAVAIYRRLAAATPEAYEGDFAMSLSGLSMCLGGVGRGDEGLAASVEAVAIYRRLAAATPEAYEGDLAGSLSTLSARLEETGWVDQGLVAGVEAVEIYRRLAALTPAAYEAPLAGSLNVLSPRLRKAGRGDEGLAASVEAVNIYRRLAAATPAAHELHFAMSLINLSIHLANAGRGDEGRVASVEAVEIYRRLAAANPAANEAHLAMSLNNVSVDLAEAGRRDEAERAQLEAQDVKERITRRRLDQGSSKPA